MKTLFLSLEGRRRYRSRLGFDPLLKAVDGPPDASRVECTQSACTLYLGGRLSAVQVWCSEPSQMGTSLTLVLLYLLGRPRRISAPNSMAASDSARNAMSFSSFHCFSSPKLPSLSCRPPQRLPHQGTPAAEARAAARPVGASVRHGGCERQRRATLERHARVGAGIGAVAVRGGAGGRRCVL